MDIELSLDEMTKAYHGNLRSYLIGLLSSLILTSLSFALVSLHLLPPHVLAWTIGGLALVQASVQLIFFFHLGKETKPKWNVMIFSSMMIILLIITLGSLWVMNDLNTRTMPASLMEMPHD
jgi:cytochrome o ubiquinol oxidase operon protein cyoD